MGHSTANRSHRARRPRRRVDIFAGLKRLLLLVAVWTCAILIGYQAVRAYLQHRAVSQAVAGLDADYNDRLQVYASELAEGQRIEGNAEYQKELLKKHFGYTERNETPIMIIHEGQESKVNGE